MTKFYIKKPICVEAFSLGIDTMPEWFKKELNVSIRLFEGADNRLLGAKILTLEGDMIAVAGDYIIKGIKGEIYPCKPDIFEETYIPR